MAGGGVTARGVGLTVSVAPLRVELTIWRENAAADAARVGEARLPAGAPNAPPANSAKMPPMNSAATPASISTRARFQEGCAPRGGSSTRQARGLWLAADELGTRRASLVPVLVRAT